MKDLCTLHEDSAVLFEEYGMTEEEFWYLPYKELQRMMNGKATSILPGIEGKLWIERLSDGSQRGRVLRHKEEATNEGLNISQRDMEKLKRQGVIYTELNIGGERNRCFVQLDRDTNCLMVAKADDVGQHLPISLLNVKLTRQQRDELRDGRVIEVKVGDYVYSIRVDLNRPGGFIVKDE